MEETAEQRATRLAQMRAYYRSHRDAILARVTSHAVEHAAEISARKKARYAASVEQERARARERYEANKDIYRANRAARYRADINKRLNAWVFTCRARGVPATPECLPYVLTLMRDPCSYCGESGGEIDHIVPISKGGLTVPENLTAACRNCNTRKRSKPVLRFLTEIARRSA